ncbi:copper amine oxidase N-terminal domain-containing protein [Paenibacillus lutrae]|uniref:Copper amine oxidase-like N-terminal domain-containing protein n=1 Tax=Paenibacillus lutrae TaxID=2078573 RepID=A0A7X3K0K2_9BACL|nr:copper amine oxidase N-terminal domain-containing protein [Paenibacillus lutrae]MVP01041.1 hypothetical protein [Paenibacillus lutrae]
MKKQWLTVLILALFLCVPANMHAQTPQIFVFVDAELMNFEEAPYVEDGITLVPFRPLFEKFGIEVLWDADTQTVLGKKGGWTISLAIDQPAAVVNGETKTLAVPARLTNGTTFIPLRFVGEATGRAVSWSGDSDAGQVIHINPTFKSNTNDLLYSGDLVYKGDMTDGIKEGKGSYSYQGELWYEGDFKSGSMEGTGRQFDLDNPSSYYEGQFAGNLANGQGKIIYDDGSYYIGEFVDGAREGTGKLYYKDGKVKYEGSYTDNIPTGTGKYYFEDGSLYYAGEFVDGNPNGFGQTYSGGHLNYEGQFVNGLKQGKGKLYSSLMQGQVMYEGDFLDDIPHGAGKWYGPDGRLNYEGQFKYFMKSGKGRILYENGDIYEGEVYDGRAEGIGKRSNSSGKVISSGYYEQDSYKAAAPDTTSTSYTIMKLKKEINQEVIDGIDEGNLYGLNPSEAIMILDLPSREALVQFKELPEQAKKEWMNSYVQEHWGNVLGVDHCYTRVTYEGITYAEADLSYELPAGEMTMKFYPDGK